MPPLKEEGQILLMSPLNSGNDRGYRQATVAPGNHRGTEIGVKALMYPTTLRQYHVST